ncbi:glycosyltransferase family 2 protein [Rhodovulum sp. 12E13]|nr:glycosyltransferase family 2 protein [Rhodovulum sp. 12E13]
MTIACIESVLADLAGGDGWPSTAGEVIVVDNASGDGSAEELARWIAARPDAPIRLIRAERNGGFSAGHNIAIAASRSEYVLLLNSDALLRTGCLSGLLAEAEAHPRIGLVGARLEDEAGAPQTSCFRCHTAMSELIRGANSGLVTSALRRWEVPLGPDPAPGDIDWASFACILVRRALIDRIGPLDEGYFLYFEDAEYCRRARSDGWSVAYAPQARAVHHRGGSGPVKARAAARERLPAYYYASRTRYFYQSGGRLGLLAANLCWLAGRGIAHARRLAGRSVPPASECEARDLWINALSPPGPRRAPGE